VQYAKLFAKDLPDNEQRLDQLGHIGQVLDQLLTRVSNFTLPTTPTLRPKLRKVARRSTPADYPIFRRQADIPTCSINAPFEIE
jgi:hypothetical protein